MNLIINNIWMLFIKCKQQTEHQQVIKEMKWILKAVINLSLADLLLNGPVDKYYQQLNDIIPLF